MRWLVGSILAVAAVTAFAGALPETVPPPPGQILDLQYTGHVSPYLPKPDGDGDGYLAPADCNDDDANVHPSMAEALNGIDDDCDGVVDDGFDTSADWPKAEIVKALWPNNKAALPEEYVLLGDAPRIVWSGKYLVAVWGDRGQRIRMARIDVSSGDAVLVDDPPHILTTKAGAPDVAWTGSKLGIVYEDRSVSSTSRNVNLMTVADDGGVVMEPMLLAPNASRPKIAWGQDRFGVVWRDDSCTAGCVTFQQIGVNGESLGDIDTFRDSFDGAAIAFSGTARRGDNDYRLGSFGIVYRYYQGYGIEPPTGLMLAIRPLDGTAIAMGYEVNVHPIPYASTLAAPAIAGNATGFALAWQETNAAMDGACTRFFALDGSQPVTEFIPDADRGRAARMTWTGSEFVMVNDNLVGSSTVARDVHFRRLDASANTHLAAGWGPWQEVNLRDSVPGSKRSRNPDLTRFDAGFGVVWAENDTRHFVLGRIWFAKISHR